jgi:iodotyrosine deiodinase
MTVSDPEMESGLLVERARQLARQMQTRRSIRAFSPRPVPREVIRAGLEIAASAPSGVNLQAWRFVAISDPVIRKSVRQLAEEEWDEFLVKNDNKPWLADKLPGWRTDLCAVIEEAPWLIAVFANEMPPGAEAGGRRNLYVTESACIATGFLVSAFHQLGLATLVHIPSAADYLEEVAVDTEGERLVMLVLVGHAADGATAAVNAVSASKKPFHTFAMILESQD